MRLLIWVIVITILLTVKSASAETRFWCDNKLISKGDSTARVLLACGEPLLRETVAFTYGGLVVKQWTYAFGPGKFLKILTVAAGAVADIRDGKRQ